jgi:hypothetical protein
LKRAIILSALLLPLLASAENVDLGSRGTLSVAPPKGWTFSANKAEDTGIALLFSPPGEVNAKLLLNIFFAPEGEKTSKDDVREKVLSACDQFVDSSVEKKKVLREFSLSGDAYGAYCVFTDASLVDQPPKKDEFKMLAIGIIRFNGEVSASVSLLFDDEKGPDFPAMLEAISSARVAKK